MTWAQIPTPERKALARTLTQRQLDVYTLRLAGCSWESISAMLRISVRTCRTHHHAAKITHDQIRHELREEAA